MAANLQMTFSNEFSWMQLRVSYWFQISHWSWSLRTQLKGIGSGNDLEPLRCHFPNLYCPIYETLVRWVNENTVFDLFHWSLFLWVQPTMSQLWYSLWCVVDDTLPKAQKEYTAHQSTKWFYLAHSKQHFQVSTLVVLVPHSIFSSQITNKLYQSNKNQMSVLTTHW